MNFLLKREFIFLCLFLGIQIAHLSDPRYSVEDVFDQVEPTDHWAMELAPGTDPQEIAKRHGHELVGKVGTLPNIFAFKQKSDTKHGVTHPFHEESKEIRWSDNQVSRKRFKRGFIPTDSLYGNQWHLHATSAYNLQNNNVHINVEPAWQQNITGSGVTIAVVDDGLEHTHPDINPNYVASASFDFNYNDYDPYPDSYLDDHGTSAAGVAGARDNSACGVGSAYRAGLAGIRLISKASTDMQEANALSYLYDMNYIYSNSWGPMDDGKRKEGPGRLASLALETSVTQGRSGKGSIYVWAGGNGKRYGDNCNYDGWANSRYTISVGAIDNNGIQSWYSEPCSMLVVSAPSSGSSISITTTDLLGSRGTSSNDCTSSFGGTSSAAPLVAGVVALILQANPNLGWRDVQGVLIATAVKNDPNDMDWKVNGANYHFNHKYGFGLVDASAAVTRAMVWQNLPSEQIATVTETGAVGNRIPESTGTTYLESTINITDSFTVEHVSVHFIATHPKRGQLVISLISPRGTVSLLADKHSDVSANYDWVFGSIFNWGENSAGTWTLRVYDGQTDNQVGSLTSWELKVTGH